MPLLRSTCWCLSLRVGCIITGCVYMVSHLVAMAYLGLISGVQTGILAHGKPGELLVTWGQYASFTHMLQAAFNIWLIYGAIRRERSVVGSYMIAQATIWLLNCMFAPDFNYHLWDNRGQVALSFMSLALRLYTYWIVVSHFAELHPANQLRRRVDPNSSRRVIPDPTMQISPRPDTRRHSRSRSRRL